MCAEAIDVPARGSRRPRWHADRVRHDGAQPGRPAAPGGRAPGASRRPGCAPSAPRSTCSSPTRAALAGQPLVPPGLDFNGRPQLIATRRGSGDGRSLLLNGHIDVVSVEPRGRLDERPVRGRGPRRQALRSRRLRHEGRDRGDGARRRDAVGARRRRCRGDLVIATNTDEESSGAGGTALVAARADRRRRDRDRADRLRRRGWPAAAPSTASSAFPAGRARRGAPA